jgi:hypothetical protein
MPTVDRAIADALTAHAQAQAAPSDRPEVVIVDVPAESKLEQLLCLEEKLRTAHEVADAHWDEWKLAVTGELNRLYPGDEAPTKGFEIPGGPMWKALSVSWRPGREYLPTDLIQQHIPQVWEAFKKRSKGFWDIRRKGKR